ncbi:glycosyl hydrolase [Aspergillus aurantiobrunneus]
MWPSHFLSFLCLALATVSTALVAQRNTKGTPWLAIDANFPDPSFIQAPDGRWYAFGTVGNGNQVQVAVSHDFHKWALLDDDGKYVMYYSGEAQIDAPHHCVGVAVSESTDPAGPYIPNLVPLACPLDQGGAIDPSGFRDTDGSRYVLYKVDGNSAGHGGDCNNGVEPLVGTPIKLQQVGPDGFTPIGEAVTILDRSTADNDGPLVEAPNLVLGSDGTYYLFYSTHCFTDPLYDVRYATAKSVHGPYVKSDGDDQVLLQGGKVGDGLELTNPGGATVCGCGDRMLFHGFCRDGVRCMYAADVEIGGGRVKIL